MNKIKSLKHLMPLKLLIPILIISLLAVVSFAASITITSTTYQTVQGVIYNVVGGFTVADNGFGVTDTAATPTALPATWTDGGIVTTSTTVGNWQYSLTVTIPATSVASPSTTYTVTVQWDQSGAGYITLGSFTFTTPATMPSTAQTMTFIIDTGKSTISAPVGILITIA